MIVPDRETEHGKLSVGLIVPDRETEHGKLSIGHRQCVEPTVAGLATSVTTYMPYYMSRIVRKPDFCLCENKGADQLRSNCEADQRLCFRYTHSTISLLLKSEISSF